jgi:hypothetical protein
MLNWESSQLTFVTVDNLILTEDSGRCQDICLHPDRVLFELKTPLLNRFFAKKLHAHILDLLDLLLRSDSGLHKSIAHASSFSDVIGNSVHKTEFRRKVEVSILVSDQEKRLVVVRHDHIIIGLEVLCD